MIITVTLNAALDRTVSVPNFQLGRRHRVVGSVTTPGGKGVNVARALKTLGEPVIATGFAGGLAGRTIIEMLARESILCDFVTIPNESRISTAVVDPTSGVQTEINERGPHVSERDLEILLEKLVYVCRGAEICVMAGSVPRGLSDNVYGEFVKELRRLEVATVVDSDGEPLREAVAVGPRVISPNVIEAEELVRYEFIEEEDHLRALREMREMGAREVLMTQAWGCYAMIPDDARGGQPRLYRAEIDPLEPVSAVGSGDAFLAGFVAARFRGGSDEESLRFAVACGAESTRHFGAGQLDAQAAESLVGEVDVRELDLSGSLSQ